VVYRLIVEKSDDAVVIINYFGDIISWNSSAERIFGYMESEVIGKYVHDILLTHGIRETVNASFHAFNEKGVDLMLGKESQVQAINKNGGIVHVQFNVNTVKVKGELFAFAFLRDISHLIARQEKLKYQASTDELTNILNRRAFLKQAKAAFSMSIRHAEPFTLLMMDIDYFKHINDQYGHLAGDIALKMFVDNISNIIRNEDIFGRFGGEEFCLAIAKTNINVSLDLAERIRVETEKLIIKNTNYCFKMTVSIGASSIKKNEQSLEAMLNRCDEALYEAKKTGRNRIVLYDAKTKY
jgi:diguanylate cyclase (GGDEF)-like protein/PAS domain S-box-containing protein